MKWILKVCLIPAILLHSGCQDSERLENFLRKAPVEPLADILRTSVPIGHLAMVAMAEQAGYTIPYESIGLSNDLTLIRIIPSNEFPFIYLEKDISEILILRFPADEDFIILSIFYLTDGQEKLDGKITEFQTVPVILEEGKLKAVYASQDIYVRDSVELKLHMGPAEILIELGRAEEPRPETTEAAIEQNAWIIDVDPSGTWDQFSDDIYSITGGTQDISAYSDPGTDEAGIIQLAILEALIQADCMLAPKDGFALLQEIDAKSSRAGSSEDLVLGTVFYQFIPECTGKVRIPLATGNFISSTGKEVDLELVK